MKWFRIETNDILLGGYTNNQIAILVKYKALYAQLEKEPTTRQLTSFFNKNELKELQNLLNSNQNETKSIKNEIELKKNHREVDLKNKRKNKELVKNSTSNLLPRIDKNIKENNNLKVITKESFSFDDTQLDLEEAIGKVKRFVKPSIAEIQDYCRERNKSVDAERFWNFYESKGWKVGKNPMKDWRAAVCNWAKDTSPVAQESYQPVVDHEKLKQAVSVAELTKQRMMEQAQKRYGA